MKRLVPPSAFYLLLLAACGASTRPSAAPPPRAVDAATPSAAPSTAPPIASRTLRGDKLGAGRFDPWPTVAVWNDGSVVALYDRGHKVLVWRQTDDPRDISVQDTRMAVVDATGERLAVLVDTPRDALKIIDVRRGPVAVASPVPSSATVGWLGNVVLLAGVQARDDARLVDLSGKVTVDRELEYSSEFVASSADGSTFIAKRSHALSFWLDLFHAGKVKRIENPPRPRGAAILGTTAVVVTEEASMNPDWPPGRQAIAYDVDSGERRDVPHADRPTAVAATPNGFVFGFEDGHVTLTSASFAVLKTFSGAGRVLSVDASPDGSLVAALREDGTISVDLAP